MPTCRPGRTERAFRPARGPRWTGPIGPGPLENMAGPSHEFRPENRPVRSGLSSVNSVGLFGPKQTWLFLNAAAFRRREPAMGSESGVVNTRQFTFEQLDAAMRQFDDGGEKSVDMEYDNGGRPFPFIQRNISVKGWSFSAVFPFHSFNVGEAERT